MKNRPLKGMILLMPFLFLAYMPVASSQSCTNPVVNGGFEAWNVPAGDLGFFFSSNGWTSQLQGVIEIWGSGFGGVPADEGIDFMELNSDGPDIVTQDMSTLPGESYNWSIAHRGRGGIDVANLEFGPPGGPYTVAQVMSDGTSDWGEYSGSYVVPAGQTTTQVRLVSVSSGSGCPSCANFIDDFEFTIASENDSDCDGVADACDVCPGGDDSIDNNGDGLADCHYLPAYDDLPAGWKCGPNKVKVAHHTGNGSCHTICIDYGSAQDHINHGDYLGPCGGSGCDDEAFMIPQIPTSPIAVNDFVAYPNPARDEINIELKSPEPGTRITIIDQLGRIIWSEQLDKNSNHLRIDISGNQFPNGIYYIQAGTDKNLQMLRISISK